jgi:plasmid maintenance system killer protein
MGGFSYKRKGESMKKVCVFMVAMVFLVCFGADVYAQEKKAAASTEKPKTVKERVVTKTATVEAIDLKTRVVTLKGKDGSVVDLKVSEEVKNLAQVKVGDQVTAKYYESIAVELLDPGTSMQVGTSDSVAKAKLGERPAGIEANVISAVVNIEAIDSKKNIATLKGPEGKIIDVKIRDPQKWKSAKVGDKVRITYTEALAVEVKEVPKPKTMKERVVTETATVEAIDLKTRMVTLKGKNGKVVELEVDGIVKNLAQVKVGDQVTAAYYESIAIELADPGTAMNVSTGQSDAKAKLNERPAGNAAKVVTVVANVEAIDTKKNVATLKGPEGKIVTVKIQDPKKWESVKVGDKLRITYTQAAAIEIRPVEKK